MSLTAFAQSKKSRSSVKAAAASCPGDYDISEAIETNPVLNAIMQPEQLNSMVVRSGCLRTAMQGSGFMRQMVQCNATGTDVVPCRMGEPSAHYINLVERSLSTVLYCTKGMFSWDTDGAGLAERRRANAPAAANLPFEDAWSDKHVPKTELLFGLLQVESGFHVGIQSGTGAVGAGQLTQVARDHISKNLIKKNGPEIAMLEKSKHPACRELAKQLRRDASGGRVMRNRCDAVSMKNGNPAMNMLYSFINIAGNERELRSVIRNPGPKLSLLLGNMKPDEREQFVFGMSVWAHNTGVGGLKNALSQYERSNVIDPLPMLQQSFGRQQRSLDERYLTIEDLLGKLCNSPGEECSVPNDSPSTTPPPSPLKTGVDGIGAALGWNHLILYAADRIKDPNRYKEVMGYLPKIMKNVKQNQERRCVGYYERGIRGVYTGTPPPPAGRAR